MKKEVKNIIYVRLLFLVLVSFSIFAIALLYSQPKNFNLTGEAVSDFDNTLISYYPFNSSLLYKDVSNSNNLGCSGQICPEYTFVGKFDGAAIFDGVNDELALYGSASNVNRNKFSFSAWVKVDVSKDGNRRTIVEFSKDGGKRRGLAISANANNGKPVITYGDDIGKYVNTADLRDGQWHHLVFTYDEITPKFYLDGVLQSLAPEEIGAPSGIQTSISVGKSLIDGNPNYFKGAIDEVRIYNQALTQQQVTELYNYVPETAQIACSDNDNGKNYTAQGTTVQSFGGITQNSSVDFCSSGQLREFFCNSTNNVAVEIYSCPSGQSCNNGKCEIDVACTPATVTADCGNKNTITTCYDSGSIEGLFNKTITPSCDNNNCNMSNITYTLVQECTYGCNYNTNNSCLTQTPQQSGACLDSDSKIDGFGASALGLYDKGNVSLLNSSTSAISYYLDSCINSTDVLEWFCDSQGNKFNITYGCPAGCSNSACVSNQDYPDEICDDTDNGKNYTYSGIVEYSLDFNDLSFPDECEQNYVIEYFCSSDDYPDFTKYYCGSSKICSNGKCVPLSTNQTQGSTDDIDECTDGESTCDGTYYTYCANGLWLDPQQIPGQCGYQSSSSENNLPARLGSTSSSSEQGSKGLFYLLIILIILIIIGVVSAIIYHLVKRKNKMQNTKSPPYKSPPPSNSKSPPPYPPSGTQTSPSQPRTFASLRLPGR
ncbi:LamG domain-containing protein [Candidatus Pacearchaeota archaeon]|nr:LamG domain-containing protein [Candidatus Pacearchaeota archaeon]